SPSSFVVKGTETLGAMSPARLRLQTHFGAAKAWPSANRRAAIFGNARLQRLPLYSETSLQPTIGLSPTPQTPSEEQAPQRGTCTTISRPFGRLHLVGSGHRLSP